MHERRPEFFVVDILIAIDKIKRATKSLTLKEFTYKEQAVDVTMRNLEIIGEATNNLLKNWNLLGETNSEWRKIVNFRNIAIHFYFGIDFYIVFNEIVKKDIPVLEKNLLNLIKQENEKTYFFEAIADAKADFAEMHRYESIDYLSEIEKIISK